MQKTTGIRKPTKLESTAKRRWIIPVVLVALLGGGAAAWWRYTHPPEDPQVAKVKALQQQVFRSLEAERTSNETKAATATREVSASTESQPALTPQEREAAMTELRAEMEKLTDEQRSQVMRSFGSVFRERMRATIKEYRALPPEKRTAFLDQQIDEWEERRAQFTRGGGRSGSGTGARGGDRPSTGQRRDGERGGPPSAERRQEWRRNMLAETTPEERAEAEMYFSDLNARREERGLDPFGPGARR